VVEKVLAADSEKKCAVCLDGKNARPPEDCGGIFGYYDLLKAINNPKHVEHQHLLDWLGGPFDPNYPYQAFLARIALARDSRDAASSGRFTFRSRDE
jgi:hypothetical protein